MALVLKDRVKETTVTTGTGDITLAGATGAFQPFSIIGDGNTTYYAVAGQTTSEWEVGLGTYTLSTNTLSRDTVLASSSSGTLVDFSAGTKDIFVTYPSEKAVYLDSIDESNSAVTIGTTAVKLGETTDTLAGLESVEVTQDPVSALQLATKQYVDTLVASGIHFHQPVRVESPINLNATYDNGTAGVGATLTNAGTQEALVIDGITVSVADRVLVYEQTTQTQNGVYVVTDVGSISTNWILTRADDADSYVIDSPDGLSEGSTFFVQQGTTGAGETYTCNTLGTIIFGTTNITFAQVSSAQIYSAGTGLTLAGTQFSISNTTVTPAAYGAASKTLTATVNAQGQLTALADTDISIPASYVTSGTLAVERGGTNIGSYAIGDLIYASGATTLSKLASAATGNVLLSGGLTTAPSWGKVALASAVSGTLPVANGGTGVTSSTGSGNVVLSTSPTLVTPILGTPQSGNFSTGTFTWPTFNQNTTGTAGNVSGVVAIANGGTGNTTGFKLFDSSFTSNINANTNRTVGAYGSYASSATNTPTNSGILYSFTSGTDGSGDGGQFWQDYITNNLYLRQRWGGSYSSWLTMISASNIGSQSVNFANSATTATNQSGGTVNATTGAFSGSISVSNNNVTGGGIILADDGDIVDLNTGHCAMRFSQGVQIFSGNRGGSAVITLGSNGTVTAGGVTSTGDITVGSGQNFSSIIMADNDEGSRLIHCNSNRIGFLNQGGGWGSYCNDDGSWASDNRIYTGYDSGVANSVSCSQWFRSLGQTGWFSATYGGGIWMTDFDWVRAYNGKGLLTDASLYAGQNLFFNSGYGSAGLAYGCRLWVRFTGATVNGSGNVSSVTLVGTGNYIVNFSSGMPDTNYAATAMALTNNATLGGAADLMVAFELQGRTTTSLPVRTSTEGGTAVTVTTGIAIFR